jgi:hypothetical protein
MNENGSSRRRGNASSGAKDFLRARPIFARPNTIQDFTCVSLSHISHRNWCGVFVATGKNPAPPLREEMGG